MWTELWKENTFYSNQILTSHSYCPRPKEKEVYANSSLSVPPTGTLFSSPPPPSPLVKTLFKPQGIYRAFTKACFHSRGQLVCKFIATKDSVYTRKEFNSQRTGLGHQHGGSDVKWKGPIWISKLVPRVLCERKTLDNNGLNQVVASSGFSENKGLGGVLSLPGS